MEKLPRLNRSVINRAAVAIAIGTTLFMIWANLAVGLIGAGPNPGNLMYSGVVAVVMVGAIISRLKPQGMERVTFAAACALVLITVIALGANMQNYPGSSVVEILGVNGFFAGLFSVSGLLFHYAARRQ